MQDDISGWSDWQLNFSQIEEISSPSELHGLVTGIICVTQAPTYEQWQHILATLDVQALDESALTLLAEEAEDLSHALAEDDLDYLPILPDDEHSLAERVQALADWCAGVVLGFGLASGHLREDEKELIEHLQDVAAVEFDEADDDEEGEQSYQELYEFVRLIPISLAMGRKKVPLEETPLLQNVPRSSVSHHSQVVEMFTPHRPS